MTRWDALAAVVGLLIGVLLTDAVIRTTTQPPRPCALIILRHGPEL